MTTNLEDSAKTNNPGHIEIAPVNSEITFSDLDQNKFFALLTPDPESTNQNPLTNNLKSEKVSVPINSAIHRNIVSEKTASYINLTGSISSTSNHSLKKSDTVNNRIKSVSAKYISSSTTKL